MDLKFVADTAERLGIPFAIVILLFAFAWRIWTWLAKNVINPVTAAHLNFVKKTAETNDAQNATLAGLSQLQIDHDKRTLASLELIATKLETGCPLLQQGYQVQPPPPPGPTQTRG